MKRKMMFLFAALAAVVVPLPVYAQSNIEAAKGVVSKTVDGVLEVLRNADTPKAEREKQILDIVNPIFDYPLMAKLVLGRTHWSSFTPDQRERFTKLFVSRLQRTYLDKLDLRHDQKVRVVDAKAVKNRVEVNTEVAGPDQKFAVVYKLHRSGNDWRIYDVVIDGVSVVASYRSQYDDFLGAKSPEDLLSTMQEKQEE